ncbi:hypothetical protein DXG03_009229 [Asterophora parasitica]|uniref:Uncharacterized protein n=1 Tax=Asterophora parasitica TaxID=117018 RepID=A0A9P7G6W1_9AGAR|nr:hypothetical protein DXG03_009229 [Asterophora parasitica]
MRATRGLFFFASIVASLSETLAVADSTFLNLHADTTSSVVSKRHLSLTSNHDHGLRKRQVTDFGSLSAAFRVATWIWTAEATPPQFNVPPGDRFFRRTYVPPPGRTAVLAEVLITVDNGFTLFVNGAMVGQSPTDDADAWKRAQGYRMALNPGPVVFAVRATNLPNPGGATNSAALLASIRITHSDNTQILMISDRTWRSNILPIAGFELPTTDDSRWVDANPLGRFGVAPWELFVSLPPVLATATLPAEETTPTSEIATSTTSEAETSTTSETTSETPTPTPEPTSTPTPTPTPASSSTVTVTQTIQQEEATAPSATGDKEKTSASSNQPVLIGAILGGMVGGLLLFLLVLVFWRRQKRKVEAAADMDTWAPAPHALSGVEAPMSQTTTNGGGYGATSASPAQQWSQQQSYSGESQYGNPQPPYRYPPPSVLATGGTTDPYQTRYNGGGGGADYQLQYGGDHSGGAYGSTSQLVPSRDVPPALAPGGGQGYYSGNVGAGAGHVQTYEQKYY